MGVDPVTIGIGMAVSSLASGFMSYQQSRAQSKAMEQSQRRNEEIARQNEQIERARLLREQRGQMGRNIVESATSGAGLSTYSDLFMDSQEQAALDLALIKYNTNIGVSTSRYNTDIKRNQIESAGRSKLIGSIAKAGMQGYSAYSASQPDVQTTPFTEQVGDETITWDKWIR